MRIPQCGEPGYERCPQCQAHRTEPHLTGCPTLTGIRCHWCNTLVYATTQPHDVDACRQQHTERNPNNKGGLR